MAIRLDPHVYANDRRLRMESGTSPKTLNNELGYFRAVYNELRGLGVIDYPNPLELVKPLRVQERELSWLTSEQIVELLQAIRSGCDNPHVEMICLATGARWSEAEKLKLHSVRNRMITFSGTKSGKVRSLRSLKPGSFSTGVSMVSRTRPLPFFVVPWPERPLSYRRGRQHTHCATPSLATSSRTAETSSRCSASWGIRAWR